MKDYQTIERWSFIQSFRCCAFMTVERIFLKPQISFLGENKKRPSKGNPLEAHISSCFYCLGCGNFFYQYGKAYFQKGGVHILELFLDFWIGKHLLHHPVRGKDLSMLLHPFLGFDQGNVLGLIRLQYYYGFLFF